MKSLPFERNSGKNQVMVECAGGKVSVYTSCAYCRHCGGVRVGNRVAASPQGRALTDLKRGAADEVLMNAAMMFNTMVRDGTAIECDDDKNEGYVRLY